MLPEEFDVPLAPFTTMRVGGPATRLVEVTSTEEFVRIVGECDNADEPVLLLAGGSNLVVGDDGFAGTTVLVRTQGQQIQVDGDTGVVTVTAAAGESWDRLVAQLVADGVSGLEALSGIPGSVGATPYQNVGAYGCEVSRYIVSVDVFDRRTREIGVLSASDCGFGYRDSCFKADPDRWLILSVTYRLALSDDSAPIAYAELAERLGVSVGDTAPTRRVRRAVLELRRSKGMVVDIDDHDTWSCGSFFTNPIVTQDVARQLPDDAPRWPVSDGLVKLSAAWLIGAAGIGKGFALPGSDAAISSRHTLAICNRGRASATQVVELATEVQARVDRQFGIRLEPEPRLIHSPLAA